MPTFKYTYFDGQARGETCRYIMAAGGIDFEDKRLSFPEWGGVKPTTLMGQIPTLEGDGIYLCQANAIARFLAKKGGLAPKTDKDAAVADMVVDSLTDLFNGAATFYFELDQAKNAELKKAFAPKMTFILNGLEKILKHNNGGDGFFVGSGLTWADIHLMSVADWLEATGAPINGFKDWPKLKALWQRVMKQPKITEYRKTRPKSDVAPNLELVRQAKAALAAQASKH